MWTGKDQRSLSHLFRNTLSVVAAGLILLAIDAEGAPALQSGTAATHIDLERLGPPVGTSLPDFTLRD